MNSVLMPMAGLLAAVENESLAEELVKGLIITIVGMGVVFAALIAIGLMTAYLSKLMAERKPSPALAPASASQPAVASMAAPAPAAPMAPAVAAPVPAAAPSAHDDLPLEHMIAITAAITAIVRMPTRIRRVRFIDDRPGLATWAEQGRRSIQKSHTFRRS